MQTYNRRGFLQFTTAAATAAVAGQLSASVPVDTSKKALRLGLLVFVSDNPESDIAHVHGLGLPTAHVSIQDVSPAMATRLRSALDRYEVEATVIHSSGPGEEKYDLVQAPPMFGLVSSRYRRERIDHLKRASDFAKQVGVPALFNQWGFIPEVPSDPLYEPTVMAAREIANHCRGNGQMFFNETGQETPTTLKRAIMDVNQPNLGVGLDTANLILYGKANPVDAVDILGDHVRSIHAKDGRWPTNPSELGEEVQIGKGLVDFKQVFTKLHKLGYTGAVTIERETSGPQQIEDVRQEKIYLEKILREVLA